MRRRWSTAAASVLCSGLLAATSAGCGSSDAPDLTGPDDSATPAPTDDMGTDGAPTTTSTTEAEGESLVEVTSDLPDGWPDDLPIPARAVLRLGQRTEQPDGQVLLTADFSVADGGANVYTAFLRALEEDDGTTILQRSSGGTESGFVGSVSFQRSAYAGNAAIDTATGTTILSVSVVLET